VAEVDLTLAARRVGEGRTADFRIIVEHTQQTLFRMVARMMGNQADAEDVLQEAYVKAFRALSEGSFDGRSKLESWLYQVASHTAIDALRRRATRRTKDTVDIDTTDVAQAPSADPELALFELETWLGELPLEQRAAVVLKSIEGKTTREVAEILGCSEGAVEQRLVRARATLRRRRGDDEERN
jgi:RNA polymerase sigma-70 factor (ECF subfamily)